MSCVYIHGVPLAAGYWTRWGDSSLEVPLRSMTCPMLPHLRTSRLTLSVKFTFFLLLCIIIIMNTYISLPYYSLLLWFGIHAAIVHTYKIMHSFASHLENASPPAPYPAFNFLHADFWDKGRVGCGLDSICGHSKVLTAPLFLIKKISYSVYKQR